MNAKMNAQEFAEKYAGQMVRYDYNSYIMDGKVVAYNGSNYVLIDVDKQSGTYMSKSALSVWTFVIDIPKGVNVISSHIKYIIPLQPPLLPIGPDDCDTCDAIGIEKCKDGCPNRESI